MFSKDDDPRVILSIEEQLGGAALLEKEARDL